MLRFATPSTLVRLQPSPPSPLFRPPDQRRTSASRFHRNASDAPPVYVGWERDLLPPRAHAGIAGTRSHRPSVTLGANVHHPPCPKLRIGRIEKAPVSVLP